MLQYIINLPFKWFYILKYSVFIFCSPLKIVPNKAAAELIAHLQATQFQKKKLVKWMFQQLTRNDICLFCFWMNPCVWTNLFKWTI